MDIRPGSTVAGPNGSIIRIDRFLGDGGFGDVFAGVMADGTEVAVKTVRTAALTQQELADFRREAAMAAQVDHPNVVRVLHFNDGSVGGGNPPYLVLELLSGGDLRKAIEARQTQGQTFTRDELLALYLQIARGMEAVNAVLVHRDVKPENILADASGNVKISDFGLAKIVGAATRTRTFKGGGTLPYMAPEAFDGRPNTVAMDVYGVGVLFHELASLRWPITASSADWRAWYRAHLLDAPPDLSATRADLPAGVVQIIARMMHKDPAARPSTWGDIISHLERGVAPTASGVPDVAALVGRATERLRTQMEREARAREAAERDELRTAVLQRAFEEPRAMLTRVVDAYNAETTTEKLTITPLENSGLEVVSTASRQKLNLGMQIVSDVEAPGLGIIRIIGGAKINPGPTLREAEQLRRGDEKLFTGFNLAYAVRNPDDQFGVWHALRFEWSPLHRNALQLSGWFAMNLNDLQHEVRRLSGLGVYQHERLNLDDKWFLELLHWLV